MYSFLDNQFIKILEEKFQLRSQEHLSEMGWNTIAKTSFADEVLEVYHNLGGVQKLPIIRLPKKFILLENEVVLMLDEGLHFNRYRLQTFRSDFYHDLEDYPIEVYRNFCRKYEKECLKSGLAGKGWTFPFAEKHFGTPEERGFFSNNGAPAWKLRAFEDFLIDVCLHHNKKKFLRIPVYQQLMLNRKLIKINDILTAGDEEQRNAFLNYIERKASS